MTIEQEQRNNIIERAKSYMIEYAPQYTFEYKSAFLYLGIIEKDGRFVVGLLETDPKENSFVVPYAVANVTFDANPLTAVNMALSYLTDPRPETKIFEHINHFSQLEGIETPDTIRGLEDALKTCIKRQNEINAYVRGVSYLNEQVRGGKSK